MEHGPEILLAPAGAALILMRVAFSLMDGEGFPWQCVTAIAAAASLAFFSARSFS